MKQQSDAYYIGQILAGNTGAMKYLIERYQHMAYTLAYRILNNCGEAEEVCQDAFLKAYKALGSLRNRANFSTWLYSIVYHASVSELRKRKTQFTSLEANENRNLTDLAEEEEEIDEPVSEKQLNSALQKLDETDRVLVSLYYLEDYDVKALSAVTGMSESNVKIRLFRARKKLYAILSACLYQK